MYSKRYLFVILLLNTIYLLNAQNIIKGKVIDNKTKKGIKFVNVLFTDLQKQQVGLAQTDALGAFQIQTNFEGKGLLKINFIGYKAFEKNINISKKNTNIGDILLEESSMQLKEVLVKEKQPLAVQKGDTTEINAEAYKANPDATAQDLMEKMPGIKVQDGKIQAHGEDVKKVLIDGKESFGEDVNATIQNFPAEMIDKVQIFDKLSDRAEFTGFNDGETSKTINIVTKYGMKKTTSGKVYAGYGTNDRYQAGGNLNVFRGERRITLLFQSNNTNQQNFSIADILGASGSNSRRGGGGRSRGGGMRSSGGSGHNSSLSDFMVSDNSGINQTNAFGINYTDKYWNKVKVNGSYFFNLSNNKTEKDIYREYINNENSGQTYNENSLSNTDNINHRLNMRIEWQIDTANSLLIIPKLTFQQNKPKTDYTGTTLIGNDIINDINSNYNSNLNGLNISNNLLFRHKFKKIGRTITLGMNGEYSENSGNSDLYSYNQYNNEIITIEEISQDANSNQYGRGISANISYTEPFIKKSLLMFDYQIGYKNSSSDKYTYNYETQQVIYTLDSSLSNMLENNYMTNNAGVSYMFNDTNNNVVFKLNYQMSDLQNNDMFFIDKNINKTFYNFLPSLMYRYRNSKRKSIQINYRTSVNAPSIEQLQDVLNNNNPTQLSKGNTDLKTDYQHNLFARYFNTNTDKGMTFFALIGGGFSNNYIGNNTFVAENDTIINNVALFSGSQLTVPENMTGYYNLRST